jgi:hypothetical protein
MIVWFSKSRWFLSFLLFYKLVFTHWKLFSSKILAWVSGIKQTTQAELGEHSRYLRRYATGNKTGKREEIEWFKCLLTHIQHCSCIFKFTFLFNTQLISQIKKNETQINTNCPSYIDNMNFQICS